MLFRKEIPVRKPLHRVVAPGGVERLTTTQIVAVASLKSRLAHEPELRRSTTRLLAALRKAETKASARAEAETSACRDGAQE
jgi:hypothetical protein